MACRLMNNLCKKCTRYNKCQSRFKIKRKQKYSHTRLRIWSQKVKRRDHHKCVKCGGKGYFAHHIKPKHLYPHLAYDVRNGQTLCNICHGEVHGVLMDEHGAYVKKEG